MEMPENWGVVEFHPETYVRDDLHPMWRYSAEDEAFYNEATKLLPPVRGFLGTGVDAQGQPIPGGVGPHNVRAMRACYDLVNPNDILEIGFNLGRSAGIWIAMLQQRCGDYWRFTSIDISTRWETYAAAGALMLHHSQVRIAHRDKLCPKTLRRTAGKRLYFVDGDHSYDGIWDDLDYIKDIADGEACDVFFDDWLPQFSALQKVVLARRDLKISYVWENMALGRLL